MEPGNPDYDRDRILAWVQDCNKYLSSARALHAHLNDDAESRQFGYRTCSQALSGQTVGCGHPFQSASGHQSAAKPISAYGSSAVMHSEKQLVQPVALPLQSSTWKKFYDFCKDRHPQMTYKFSEERINNALLTAIMKKTVSIETINSMKATWCLSETQMHAFHHVFVECFSENSPPAPATLVAKRVVKRGCEVSASAADIPESRSSSASSSSQTRTKPWPSNCTPSSPKTQQAILIKKPVQLSSSDSRNHPALRQELNRLGVDSATIERIIALKPYDMELSVLKHTLRNDVGLDDHNAHLVACHIRFLSAVDNTNKGRNQPSSELQDKKVSLSAIRQNEKPSSLCDSEDDVVLATKLSLRDISEPTFSTLVVGASIDSRIASSFDHETTLFAGTRNADLNGDIHNTIDEIPPGKKFEKIHFINMPESTFDDPKKNRVLFNKISNLLVDYGKLFISFATNGQGYSNQTFADRILKPAGFGQFCFLVKSSINMIASKTGAPESLVPESAEVVCQSAISSACSGVISVQHQPPGTPVKQVWKEYTLAKKQLINMMQGGKTPLDHDTIQKALSSPANPEYDLSIEEFASLKVRYDAWHDHKPVSGLPLNHEIRNVNARLREAREIYKALVDEEGYSTDARPGTTPVRQPVNSANDLAASHLHLARQNTASKQQIDRIIEALKKEFTDLKSDIVSRHIPFLDLSEDDIAQAVAGRKSALDKILVESQIRESCYPTSGDTGLIS